MWQHVAQKGHCTFFYSNSIKFKVVEALAGHVQVI
jgi:hypothetical protein